jgi:hypothetical protein
MATMVEHDVTAIRGRTDETHRRFVDAFNRGDAAGAARQLLHAGCPHPAARETSLQES